MQWNHDEGTTSCSDHVDYVLEYTLTKVKGCPEPFSPQVRNVTSTDKEYTLNNLEYFSEYSITVSARRRSVKYDYTSQTDSVVTEQAGKTNLINHWGINN